MLVGFVSSQYEVTGFRLANEKIVEAESRLNSIASNIPGYIYQRIMRNDGTIEVVYCSPSLGKMLGIDETEVSVSRSFYDYVHPDDRAILLSAIRASAADLSVFREEFRLVSPSGAVHWLRSDAPPRLMQNGEIVWDGLAIEISNEKRWETEIASLAFRDPLTGLMTREAWRQALAMHLSATGHEGRRCGLLYFDIEAFHDLNDRLGQRVGDEVLKKIAQRLDGIAASVAGVAARLGGDEFAILVPAYTDADALAYLADASIDGLALPLQVGAERLAIQTRVGATIYAEGNADETQSKDVTSEMMTQAELALRWAKQADCAHVVYSAAQDDRFQNKAILAKSLERAIADNELALHYQPLVDLASGRIVSAEALVRWNHSTLGMQRPDLFIPLAEELGLIVQLGGWVFKEAVRQRTVWRDAGLAPPPIAINVSGNQLVEPGFVNLVADVLTNLQAIAGDFELELTEGEVIEASPQIMASLHALRDMGFAITIDDFGTGHATFRYLRDFPVDKVKIDQLFVRKLVRGSNDALIIHAVLSLARSMNIRFVAEGIETEMPRDFLQSEGCEIGQGYLFSMPLVAEDFAWMLANNVKLPLRLSIEALAQMNDIKPHRAKGAHSR